MLEPMNSKMTDVLKNQFRSNLYQDVLALSGFCSKEELETMLTDAIDMVVKKIESDEAGKTQGN